MNLDISVVKNKTQNKEGNTKITFSETESTAKQHSTFVCYCLYFVSECLGSNSNTTQYIYYLQTGF